MVHCILVKSCNSKCFVVLDGELFGSGAWGSIVEVEPLLPLGVAMAGQRLARLPGRLRALLIAPASHQRPLGVWCAPAGWTRERVKGCGPWPQGILLKPSRINSAGPDPLDSLHRDDFVGLSSVPISLRTYFGGLYARSQVRMGSSLAMWSEYFPKGTVVGTALPCR